MEHKSEEAGPSEDQPEKVKKKTNWRKEATEAKKRATRSQNLLKSTLTDVDTETLNSAINNILPDTLLVRRSDVFRIVAEYNRLLREKLRL